MKKHSIEFVCAGNIARSKIAEAYAKRYAVESGLEKRVRKQTGFGLDILSSGIHVDAYERGVFPDDVAAKLREVAPNFPGYAEGMSLWGMYRLLTAHDGFFGDLVLAEQDLRADNPSPCQTEPLQDGSKRLILAFTGSVEEAVNQLYDAAYACADPIDEGLGHRSPTYEGSFEVSTIWKKAGMDAYEKGSLGRVEYNPNGSPNLQKYREFVNLICEATKRILDNAAGGRDRG